MRARVMPIDSNKDFRMWPSWPRRSFGGGSRNAVTVLRVWSVVIQRKNPVPARSAARPRALSLLGSAE